MRLLDASGTFPTDADTAVVCISRFELQLLSSALGEALEAVEEWEFHTRLGATCAEAEELRTRIREILRSTF